MTCLKTGKIKQLKKNKIIPNVANNLDYDKSTKDNLKILLFDPNKIKIIQKRKKLV